MDFGPGLVGGAKLGPAKVQAGGGAYYNMTIENGEITANTKVVAEGKAEFKGAVADGGSWTAKRNIEDVPLDQTDLFYGIGEDPNSEITWDYGVSYKNKQITGERSSISKELEFKTNNRNTSAVSLAIIRVEFGINNQNALDALNYIPSAEPGTFNSFYSPNTTPNNLGRRK